MVPCKNTHTGQIYQICKDQPISQCYRDAFLTEEFYKNLTKCNNYMVDFTVNGVLSIFAICSADANDDYTIRLWAPLEAEEAADDGRSRISGITSKSTKT